MDLQSQQDTRKSTAALGSSAAGGQMAGLHRAAASLLDLDQQRMPAALHKQASATGQLTVPDFTGFS